MRRLLPLLLVALLGVPACGDDGGSADTLPTLVIDDDLTVGETFRQGGVTITVYGVERAGDLVVADAEACSPADAPPGVPIEEAAWQLRVEGQSESLPRTVMRHPPPAARPLWPARVSLDSGDCFRGKVPFEVDRGVSPSQVVFAQLGQPVAWRIPDA